MLTNKPLQRILDSTRKEETKYCWLRAIQIYTTTLDSVFTRQDYASAGEIGERIGFCFLRAAMQAETREEFMKRLEDAIRAYDTAYGCYDKTEGEQNEGRMLRCRALAKYLGHWLTSNPSEKRELLDECWYLTTKALHTFEESDDGVAYYETYHKLSSAAFQNFQFQWESQSSEKILQEAIAYGEHAITLLSTRDTPSQIALARVYAKTAAYLAVFIHYFLSDMDEWERVFLKARRYWEKAYGLAADTALLELLTISHDFDYLFNFDEILIYYEEALNHAKTTRDKYLIGTALDMLAYANLWKGVEIEDPDERLTIFQTALHYSKAAKRQFASLSLISPRGSFFWPEAPYCEYYWNLALYEPNQKKKRELLTEAANNGGYAVKLAERSGLPEILSGAYHTFSKILESLARNEPRSEKRKLLEKALEYRKESLRLLEQLYSTNYWNLGVGWMYLADVKAKLADLEKEPRNKINLLTEAVCDKEQGLHHWVKIQRCFEMVGILGNEVQKVLGRFQCSYAELLNRLYRLTDNIDLQKRAIQFLDEAAETYHKLDMISHVAECYWKVGRLYDDLGEYLEAAKNFSLASTYYTQAINRVPQLEEFYRTHASYMDAWSEIEHAKHHHIGKRHEHAQQHYTKAATLHQSTESWSHLSPNYFAWARLEEAEYYSRHERIEEAKNSFQDAAQLFLETKQSIETKVDSIEDADEKKLSYNLIKASTVRHTYCLGRIALEEARLLDRQGRHLESSVQYGIAASTFQDVADALEQDRDCQEITPIIELSKAWELMMQAEAQVSPELYAQASQRFEQAKERTTDERGRVLAMGHSLFCQALESGTRFETARDATTYTQAKRYLGAAENYYVKAGVHTASAYARATHRLLDAYWYIYQAETEQDPRKQSQYYQFAATLLQTSVDSFSRARHPEKTEQVNRLLEKVLEEQTLTMALTEILHTPLTTLSTESFVTLSQTYEHAVGFERFDHAHIQGHITLPEYGTVSEAIEYRLDLVNVGKTLGLLIRIDYLIPNDCTILITPSQYSVEDGSLNLNGWALGSLKTESITLSFRAHKAGSFTVNPQVIYVDETGAFKSCQPKPVTLLVQPQSTFEFETHMARNVFDYLIQSFIDDYMRKRLLLETSGWRSLMEIVKYGHVPKSSVYGGRGRSGQAIAELERRGLVESRIFLGERGRGGQIRRIRVAYDRETIKRYIDQHIRKK